MMLGAISPLNVSPNNPNTLIDANASSFSPVKTAPISTYANQNAPVSTKVTAADFVENKSESTDIMGTLKKYAPYIIGAIVLLYILKNKN